MVGQFTSAEETLRKGMKEVFRNRFLASGPIVVIRPMEMFEDGLSQVEERMLQELVAGAGGRKAIAWSGQELSDQDVLSNVDDVQ